MKILCKSMLGTDFYPFAEVVALRSTVEADYNGKVFYLNCDAEQKSWGIAFVMKEGYTAVMPTNIGLIIGNKDGYVYWVSYASKPEAQDYSFSVKKGDKVIAQYRVICII